ncbi:apolipoprotein N-acyltransferase [Nocardioides panacisoli]|uniref:apolipoprotein N-acyltransferase n=1 Tax=Nocardioides panacisoli TaxID=627624 RepID=UPI001C631544|nr:apolipoprotein N-acyltransferase [Nocardioides panacisoli]QYJ05066.1 apolipoprotein N-acyltransferase [Nocardioides panacisoli]
MLLRLPLAVAAGFALTGAFEPWGWAPLALVGLLGFALATAPLTVPRAGVVGLAFGVSFYFSHIWWMREAVGTDAWLALSAIEAAFYGLVGACVPLLRRLPAWPLWLAALWATVEVLRSVWPFSGMPWGRVSFAAVDTPVADAAAYVGLTGLSFLLALVAFLLAAWVEPWLPGSVPGRGGPLRRRAALAGAIAVLAVLLVPSVRPYPVAESGEATVAVVQGNVPGAGDDILLDHRQVTANHADATRTLAADVAAGRVPDPDFVLWPENATAVDPFADTEVTAEIRDAVATIDRPVVVGGLVDDGPDHVLNQGIVWDPVTGPGDRYTKRHPVAYGEYIPYREYWEPNFGRLSEIERNMKTGTRTAPLDVAGIPVGDAICFDIAYDEVMRDQVRDGAELLTVQTSNAIFIFTDQIEQQFAITRLRAIETGRALAVASPNGRTGVIAADGTILAAAENRTQEVLVERVGLSTTLTPAVRMGPWPLRFLTVSSLVSLLLGSLAYRRALARSPRTEHDGTTPSAEPAGTGADPSEDPVA